MIVPPMSTLGLFYHAESELDEVRSEKRTSKIPMGFFIHVPLKFQWPSEIPGPIGGPIFGGTSLILEPIHILHTFGCIQSLYPTLSARIISYKELGFAYAHDLKTKHPTITLLIISLDVQLIFPMMTP
jgi:hypothetical protein